jgi:hypothetical protein
MPKKPLIGSDSGVRGRASNRAPFDITTRYQGQDLSTSNPSPYLRARAHAARTHRRRIHVAVSLQPTGAYPNTTWADTPSVEYMYINMCTLAREGVPGGDGTIVPEGKTGWQ